jgi:hypothetical protein
MNKEREMASSLLSNLYAEVGFILFALQQKHQHSTLGTGTVDRGQQPAEQLVRRDRCVWFDPSL